MLFETLGYYKFNESFGDSSKEEDELTKEQKIFILVGVICYLFLTFYVAIKYPIGGNVIISVIIAFFCTTAFWIIKIIELLFGTFELDQKPKKLKRKTQKRRKRNDKYYDPIY